VVRSGAGDTVEPMNNIRRRTAEHMVMSKAVSPHVLTAVEVDYEAVDRVRRAHGARFKEEEGFSLTYMPFIARALADALREYPYMNASVGEGELVVHHRVNLAVAVDINFEGLLAPVVKDADGKRLRAIAREIVDLAKRTRSKQLSADDIMDGTFTITNAGSYGTMMQFPIINQPQVAILGTGAVVKRPVVVTDENGSDSIAVRSMVYLALTYDHRLVDGADAARFLVSMKQRLEDGSFEAELGLG
jgi:2-oxoglutarate dehydrogenase E2 component (dihydrolipoamide succinyltransferase)